MAYFDSSADKYQRLGKVIGDGLVALLFLALLIIALNIISS
jgi:hypothetical protein